MSQVHCSVCHRLEEWTEEGRRVLTEGGGRRPAGDPRGAAWDTIERAWAQGRTIVGPCPACGQPLMGPAHIPAAGWVLDFPGGALTVGDDQSVTGPQGPLSVEEARAYVLEQTAPPSWLRRVRPARSAAQAMMITSVLGPLTAFLLAVLVLSIFMRPAAGEWAKVGARLLEALQ